jgi:hypothetical protein
MKRNQETTMRTMPRIAITVCALTVAALSTAPLAAQTNQAAPPAARGPQEGIKVHGHWTITVRNADGTIASNNEFENALESSGGVFLRDIIQRSATPGFWSVFVFDGLCPVDAIGSTVCRLTESGSGQTGPNVYPTLVVGGASAFLSATFTATTAGTVSGVQTYLTVCGSSQSSQACASSAAAPTGAGPFSSRGLAQPIPVQAGQIVQVTVTFSFS